MSRHRLLLLVAIGSSLAGCQGSSTPAPPGTLAFTSPADSVWTNGTVDVAIVATGFTPPSVDLLVDGVQVQKLSPPFETKLDTTALAEGPRALKARAQAGNQVVESDHVA